MRKIVTICGMSLGLLAESVISLYPRVFSFEQRLQRKHIEQMQFDSIYAWRGWGLVNLGVRNNFIEGNRQVIVGLPQVGFDRSYMLSNGELLVGVDLNASGGQMAIEKKTVFRGYGLGGYVLWKTKTDCFVSLATKIVQIFPQIYEQTAKNTMWFLDIGGGKKFNLEGNYFIEAEFFFGTGVIADTHLRQKVKLDSQTNIPFNFLTTFALGKVIDKHQVKIKISPFFDVYAKGKIYEQIGNQLIVEKPNWRFDLLLSIAYDAKLLEDTHFYTYADFNALRFEFTMGAGFRVAFGENKNFPLKYPTLKLKKLKKTYLK